MNKIGIAGWTQTLFQRRRDDVSRNELIFYTVRDFLDKYKMEAGDVDSIVSASCDTVDGISISNAYAADAMGAFMKEESKVEEDGAYALMYAYFRLLMGQWKNCLIIAHGKTSDAGPAFYSNMSCDPFLMRPLGVETISAAALQANAYYHRYGVGEKEAAEVVVKNRAAGMGNPHAQIKKEMSVDDVMNSSYLAAPIKMYDASPISDGAAVVLLAREDFAREVTDSPIWIEGLGFFQDSYYPGYKDLHLSESCRMAAQKAYQEAGIKDPRQEIDMAEVTENFSFYELMLYENLSLCKEGEGAGLVKDGVTYPGGELPVNPSGGALCANALMVTGLVRIIECCQQLTGQAGEHQLEKSPQKALAHASSGLFLQSNLVTILSL